MGAFGKMLQEKLGKHDPSDVDKLILDDFFSKVRVLTEDHKNTLEEYTDLKHLSLNGFGLACLKNLPLLPSVVNLELRENLLTGDDFDLILKAFPKVLKLKLGGNPIKNFENFNVFAKSELKILELFETSVGNKKGYREILFHKIKTLEIIDQNDRDGYQVETYLTDEDEDDYEEGEEDNNNEPNNIMDDKDKIIEGVSEKKGKDVFDETSDNEDGEYEAEEDGEDQFDEDFDEEEEDFELSQVGSDNEVKKVKINIKHTKKDA